MKIITTLVYIVGLQYASIAQVKATIPPQPAAENSGISFFVSTPASELPRPKLTSSAQLRDVVITALPESDKAIASMHIELDMLGSFVFKKDEALKIPQNREVYIEDMLTGKVMNLKMAQLYTFTVDKWIPNRFVLHVLDKTNDEALTASR